MSVSDAAAIASAAVADAAAHTGATNSPLKADRSPPFPAVRRGYRGGERLLEYWCRGWVMHAGGGAAMWRRRRRLQQLETEIAQGKAERAELRRRLDWFEAIAAAAGADPPGSDPEGLAVLSTVLPSARPASTTSRSTGPPRAGLQSTVPPAPPPALIAAGRDLRGHDVPVRLDVAGSEVIAIVGGPGNPREWWTAIWQTAGPDSGPETADPEEAPA